MAEAKVKKKVVKSKLSKPNPKQKQLQYSIEISTDAVKVIRVDAKGRIVNSGFAKLDGDFMWTDKSWIDRLSQKVREASRDARIPKGSGFACSVVASGPQVIMQRFTQPELEHVAMINNAKNEISSYLPSTASQFIISAEVQSKIEGDEDNPPSMNVFVAAMPKEMAIAISTAVTWAGFRVQSLDISENVRSRLVKRYATIESGTPKSFGILDLTSTQPNITLYLDGSFYSTHYFSDTQRRAGVPQEGQTLDEIESLMSSLEGIKGSSGGSVTSEPEHDVEAVLSEISFVVDFIRYQERGSNLECILIMGKTQPSFSQRLSSGLDMPVYANELWMRSDIVDGVKGDPGFYLDAYGSGIPSSVIAVKHMMDLKTEVIIKNPGARMFAIASGLMLTLVALLAVGIIVPFIREQSLQNDYDALDSLEASVNVFIAGSPTPAYVAALQEEVSFIVSRIEGVHNFYSEFAQASYIVPLLFQSQFADESGGFASISTLTASADTVEIAATARNFIHLADILEDLRAYDLFHDPSPNPDADQEWYPFAEQPFRTFRAGVFSTVVEVDTTNNPPYSVANEEAMEHSTVFEATLIMRRGEGLR